MTALDYSNVPTLTLVMLDAVNPNPWRRGLPPGRYYPGMVDDFEVSFAVAGPKWHRKRTPEQKAAYLELKRRNQEACKR